MTKKEYEREYGKTKLDQILEFMAILFLPFAIVEQLCIYGVTHPDQIISLLLVLMIFLIPLAVQVVKKLRK